MHGLVTSLNCPPKCSNARSRSPSIIESITLPCMLSSLLFPQINNLFWAFHFYLCRHHCQVISGSPLECEGMLSHVLTYLASVMNHMGSIQRVLFYVSSKKQSTGFGSISKMGNVKGAMSRGFCCFRSILCWNHYFKQKASVKLQWRYHMNFIREG